MITYSPRQLVAQEEGEDRHQDQVARRAVRDAPVLLGPAAKDAALVPRAPASLAMKPKGNSSANVLYVVVLASPKRRTVLAPAARLARTQLVARHHAAKHRRGHPLGCCPTSFARSPTPLPGVSTATVPKRGVHRA